MYESQWGSLSAACSFFFIASLMTIRISTTSYMRICIRCCMSRENPYQVMQVTCAVSERGMKSMACMHHYPLWLTCKVASPIDTLSSDYSNLLQLHVKFQYLFSHPVKGWTYAWKALLMMIRGMILICHNCEIFPYNYIITVWNILFTWNYKHTFNGLRWANRVKKWCCQVFNPWIVLPV